MPDFDLHAKHAFLTYPQCDIPAGDVLADLATICGARWSFIAVGHELHEDGGDHLHALIAFKRKFRTRNERYFDLERGGRRFHPNLQAARDLSDVYNYVTKDGDFVEQGDKPPCLLPPGQSRPSKRDAAFAALDAECDTVEDFMSALRERHPYEFFTRGSAIRTQVESVKRHRWVYEPDYAPDSFQLPGAVQDWLDTEFAEEEREPRPRSLMLVGPSKTGKTAWARSLGRHMFFRVNFNLDDWDPLATYLVIDDMPMDRVPGWKVLLGSMGDMVLYDRYRAKTRITWGPKKCCIILCNPGVDWRYSEIWKKEAEWCEANVEVVEIDGLLY
ncbi:replication-associated protein [Gopherus associated circular DNA virus 5]|nr:replication-associated protein [Gopherus associated circular DNA virus 5]